MDEGESTQTVFCVSPLKRGSVFTALSVLIIQILSEVKVTGGLEPAWTCYEDIGRCYYLSDLNMTQLGAGCWCEENQGRLVTIGSEKELEVLRELMTAANKDFGYYTGADDRNKEGVWLWQDGTPADPQLPWHAWGYASEPDNYNNAEHCSILTDRLWWEGPGMRTFVNYDAFDVGCDMEIHFICEKHEVFFSERRWNTKSLDRRYTDKILLTSTTRSLLECLSLCTNNCRCLSAAYHKDSATCVMYDNHYSRLDSGVITPGYKYFD